MSAITHTLVLGNLLSNDQSTLYLDASSGFDANLPITVVAVASTRLGTAVTFKEMGPSALLSNFSVTTKASGDAPFTLTAPVTNSAGAFTYSSSNPAVATVSGSTVTIVGAGTTTITATQLATATYASNSITATFTVTPPLISLNNGTISYNGNAADVPTNSALFIQANPRGTGSEWFAVVKDGMKAAISAYASGTNAPFVPSGQSVPVPFNNIVTTLMTDFFLMFQSKSNFNSPIGSWDTANVTNMSVIFNNCSAFNQPIGSWNTANVLYMGDMFNGAANFNQAINSWNTAKVVDMQSMFKGAASFNQEIYSWNTANVTSFYTTFTNATSFNQAIGSWNVANVRDMSSMFNGATNFNQPLNSWITANVIVMQHMFYRAYNFNQPINTWDVVNVIYFGEFRTFSALSTENTPPKFR